MTRLTDEEVMPKKKPKSALTWSSITMISMALGCGTDTPNEKIATEARHEEPKRAWLVHEIERGTDPPPFDLKVYVKLIYAQPRDEAAIRECLAKAVEEFYPNDDATRDRQLYFTIRTSAAEWASQSHLPIGDATFDLPRGKKLESIEQAESVEIHLPDGMNYN